MNRPDALVFTFNSVHMCPQKLYHVVKIILCICQKRFFIKRNFTVFVSSIETRFLRVLILGSTFFATMLKVTGKSNEDCRESAN